MTMADIVSVSWVDIWLYSNIVERVVYAKKRRSKSCCRRRRWLCAREAKDELREQCCAAARCVSASSDECNSRRAASHVGYRPTYRYVAMLASLSESMTSVQLNDVKTWRRD